MLELEQIKKLHDKAYEHNQSTREKAADDLVFYWVTHWDDQLLEDTQLGYRGEFDVLRKAGRDILADLESNEVQVDFVPIDESRDDAADLLDGIYRADSRANTSLEAFDNADLENIVCGTGAWELCTEYETLRDGSQNQVIKRKPIYEANNTLFWDPSAKRLDKSDAKYVSILASYSEDGYKDFVEELTGERPDEINPSNFSTPEHSFVFPWILGKSKVIYVSTFYHRKMVKDKILILENFLGQQLTVSEKELEKVMDDLMDAGYEIVSEKTVDRWEVTKYICSGEDVLWSGVIAGEHIPVVPVYGERAMVEGEEHYEGVTRLAKDPQRLRDFQLSYLADIAARSPREKPVFTPEQVAGHEDMYEENGPDNNYPYVLQNLRDSQGNPLPIGPIATLPAPNIPPALAACIELSRQSIEDVANPGIPQDVADTDLSGKAVLALQSRIDRQSVVYQKHRKHARRRDGEIYASMAAQIYDVPRDVQVVMPDGTTKTVKVLEQVIDQESGELVTLRDLTNAEFKVYSQIGPSYSSQKEQTIDRLDTMIQGLPPGEPLRNILLLKQLKLMDGVDFEDVRDYANQQLVLMGIKKPETKEEEQLLVQAQQQGEQRSAEMILAQAEMLKGEADKMREQRENIKMRLEYQSKDIKNQIEAFNAETKRMDTQIDAQEAGAKINTENIEAFGKQLDNTAKVIQLSDIKKLSDGELLNLASGG